MPWYYYVLAILGLLGIGFAIGGHFPFSWVKEKIRREIEEIFTLQPKTPPSSSPPASQSNKKTTAV